MMVGVVGRQPHVIKYSDLPYCNWFLWLKDHDIHRELIPLLLWNS